MSIENTEKVTGAKHMERRIIRVDNMADQAGIAAALRRAFAERPMPVRFDDSDPFDALLKQIH